MLVSVSVCIIRISSTYLQQLMMLCFCNIRVMCLCSRYCRNITVGLMWGQHGQNVCLFIKFVIEVRDVLGNYKT
jgi:hypothetical protein